jgi:NADH-quinone oxidoreductase subunit N
MQNEMHSKVLADLFPQLIPEMILAALACVLFLGGTFKVSRALWASVTLAGLALAGASLLWPPHIPGPDRAASDKVLSEVEKSAQKNLENERKQMEIFASPLVFDPLTNLIRWIALGGGVVLTLMGWSEVPKRQASDFFACLILIVAGTGLTAAANDLVLMFVALELVSIPTYVLLYLPRHDQQSQEAAMKYFMLSIFSSGFLLFGFSYLYGISGTTNLAALQQALNVSTEPRQALPALSLVALIMVVAALGFRITAVPFHFYAPDVYQGTSTVGAGMLAFIPKVVGFVALIRILGFVLPQGIPARRGMVEVGLSHHVPILFWFLAVVSMFLGNVMGLLQTNVKRLLGYSSVAHAGYMLMALATAPFLPHDGKGPDGLTALMFYLVAYGAMTVGVFAVLSYLDDPARPCETIDDLAGLGVSRPGVALIMAIFLFSLIGIPLTAGFLGKFLIFFGAMAVPSPDHQVLFRVLALLGVLNAAIGGWYYLRILAVMYLRQPLHPFVGRKSWPGLATLWMCVVLTMGLGIWPGGDWLMRAAQLATEAKK